MRHLGWVLLLAAVVSAQDKDFDRARKRLGALEADVMKTIDKAAPAVGAVLNFATVIDFRTGKVTMRPRSQGSGVVITRDGFLLTNVHVVEGGGLGFAVPMDVLRKLVPRLAKGERLRLGFLGVSVIAAKRGLEIALVTEKNSKGVATTAASLGLKKGDVLLAIGGIELKRLEDLRATLARFVVGDKLEVRFVRDGKEQTASAVLGER